MQSAALASEPGANRATLEPESFSATSDGRYRVVGFLGSGGMGSVFEVEHTGLRRCFALKLLRADLAQNAQLGQRFEHETRALAALESDYIVRIVDSGALSDGRAYFVMERLRGEDLRHVLQRSPTLPVTRAVNLAIDACLGLQVAHAAGLVHRDLKPENLFVARLDGAGERCTLLDFGVAKLTDTEQTQPGELIGTARYMAPEQVAHEGELGPRTDVFALAVILYRCLTGKHPFEADSLERVLYKIMHAAPPAIERPGVPRELEAVVLRALSKSAAERPESALALAHELLPFAQVARELGPRAPWSVELPTSPHLSESDVTLDVAPAPRAATPSEKRASRRTWPRVAAGALALVGAAALGAFWGQSRAVSMPSATLRPASLAALSTVAGRRLSATDTAPVPTPSPSALSAAPAPVLVKSAVSKPRRAATDRRAASAGSAERSPSWFNPRNPYGE